MYITRLINLKKILSEKSCFLLGPRQTGKSSLIDHEFQKHVTIDLLDDEIYLRLQQNPKNLGQYIPDSTKIVIVDEIQRVPVLLNEVHRLIEKRKLKFLLTGSSARKLRKKGVNLLGGRARSRVLHPLVSGELKDKFNLEKSLMYGTLPSIYFSSEPLDDLKSYVSEYLKEEIIAEAATRNIPAFARFLEVAAIANGQMLNYEKVSNDAQVARSTVQSYYQILRDTLIGRDLVAYRKTQTRKAIQTNKFFLFDLGVVNCLNKNKILNENSPEYGFALEAHLHHELSSFCDYKGNHELNYWRSQSGLEVDFLINAEWAIEVKSTKTLDRGDLKGILAISDDLRLKRKTIVCREPFPRKIGDVEVLPVQIFLEELWS
jgi:predicted AAA+ superfamily ATPase